MSAKNKSNTDAALLLEEQLSKEFNINKSRLKLAVLFLLSVIQVCSVNLTKVASAMRAPLGPVPATGASSDSLRCLRFLLPPSPGSSSSSSLLLRSF